MTAHTGRPLKVGVQLPEVEREVRWPELLDMIRAVEDLGYDSVWLGEHLLYRWLDRPPRRPVRARIGSRLERDRVSCLRLSVRPPDRPVRGGVHDHPRSPAGRRGRLRWPLL